MSKRLGIYNANVLRYVVLYTSRPMHLTLIDHRQQPSLNQKSNQLLTLEVDPAWHWQHRCIDAVVGLYMPMPVNLTKRVIFACRLQSFFR